MAKLKDVTQIYKRYIQIFTPLGFGAWVNGVLNDAMNKLENERR